MSVLPPEQKGTQIASYRLFFIESARIEYAATFDAEDDAAAGQVVRERQRGRIAELWNQDRYLAEYQLAARAP